MLTSFSDNAQIFAFLGATIGVLISAFTTLNSIRRDRNEIEKKIEEARTKINEAQDKYIDLPRTGSGDVELTEQRFLQIIKLIEARQASGEKWLSVLEDISRRYHTQALTQATWQFWLSSLAAIAGLVMIGLSLFVYLNEANKTGFPFGAIPGILVEAISILFFREAKEIRERATVLLDKSRIDNMREKALEIVNTIDNAELRDAVKTEMALQMTEISSSPVSSIITDLLKLNFRSEKQ